MRLGFCAGCLGAYLRRQAARTAQLSALQACIAPLAERDLAHASSRFRLNFARNLAGHLLHGREPHCTGPSLWWSAFLDTVADEGSV